MWQATCHTRYIGNSFAHRKEKTLMGLITGLSEVGHYPSNINSLTYFLGYTNDTNDSPLACHVGPRLGRGIPTDRDSACIYSRTHDQPLQRTALCGSIARRGWFVRTSPRPWISTGVLERRATVYCLRSTIYNQRTTVYGEPCIMEH